MSREWKRGEIAVIYGSRVMRAERGYGSRLECGWVWPDGSFSSDEATVSGARPVAVIDPNDSKEVDRLRDALGGDHYYGTSDLLAASVAEFIEPKPPRPTEPTGLGAVVEDANGKRWVRGRDSDNKWHPQDGRPGNGRLGPWVNYAEINVARVLSEGVQP